MTAPERRLDELLAGRAVGGLSRDEDRELDRLLRQRPSADADAFERTAAELLVALVEPAESMPASLRDRLAARAREFEAGRGC